MSGKHVGTTGDDVSFSFDSNWVPLYYEGGTVIGKAKVNGNLIEIELDDSTPMIAELLSENLVGFSTVMLHADRAEDIINKEKENTDE